MKDSSFKNTDKQRAGSDKAGTAQTLVRRPNPQKDPGAPRRKHGLDAYRTRRIVPPGAEELQQETRAIARELIADLGGEQKVSASQRLVVSMLAADLLYVLIADRYLAEHPKEILRKSRYGVDFSPLLGRRTSYVNSVRSHLIALGIRDKADKPERLDEYVKKFQRSCGDAHGCLEGDAGQGRDTAPPDSAKAAQGVCTMPDGETE